MAGVVIVEWLPLVLMALMVYGLVRGVVGISRGAKGAVTKLTGPRDGASPLELNPPQPIEGDEEELDVVGESHYQPHLQRVLASLNAQGRRECRAVLRREPKNKHDPNAVRVEIAGQPVGYIPRASAEWVSSSMRRRRLETMPANADVGGEKYIGVRLVVSADSLD